MQQLNELSREVLETLVRCTLSNAKVKNVQIYDDTLESSDLCKILRFIRTTKNIEDAISLINEHGDDCHLRNSVSYVIPWNYNASPDFRFEMSEPVLEFPKKFVGNIFRVDNSGKETKIVTLDDISLSKPYVPSHELTSLAVRRFRKTKALPLSIQALLPPTWICNGFKEPFQYDWSLIGFNAQENMQRHLERGFYDSLEVVSFRNLSLGKNPTLISREQEKDFEKDLYVFLVEELRVPYRAKDVLTGLKKELSDYVIKNDGFSLGFGDFYHETGNIYFRDVRNPIPPEERTERARVVG